jgi:hypothetical protein
VAAGDDEEEEEEEDGACAGACGFRDEPHESAGT